MKFFDQIRGRNPFQGDVIPSRVSLLKPGRPCLPFPHPGNYKDPIGILDSIFWGAEAEKGPARHNRYLSVPGLPYVLVSRDPDVIRSILIDTGDRPGQFDRDQSPSAGIARATGEDSLLYSNGDRWHRQKKLAACPFGRTTLFQPERFGDFEQTFRQTVRERLDRLRQRQAASGERVIRIKLEPEIQVVMLEMLVNNFFGAGVSYDELRNRYIPAMIRLVTHMVSDTVVPRSRNFLTTYVLGRAQMNRDRRDFEELTDIALAGRPEGKGLWGHFNCEATDAQLRSNIRVFLAGALEATTSLAAWALSHLARNQPLQDRVHEEVKDLDEYNPDNLKQAETLNLVITETLRLTPSLYFLPRMASQDRCVTMAGDRKMHIPKGTHIALAVWHSNRCEDFWGREVTGFPADQFAPERWDALERQGRKMSDLPHFGFGHGPRACPGKYLGMLEVGLAVGAFVKLFKFKAIRPNLDVVAGVSTKPRDGVEVDLELR